MTQCNCKICVEARALESTLEIGGTVAQTIPDIAGRDIRTATSDPDSEED